ncbi:MAG: AtpZ/AtpI family protein [Bacteroidota bacterium]
MKYAGMTTQLGASIGVCAFIGIYLDGYFEVKPILTVLMSLVGVFGGLYLALKDLL